MLLALVRSTSGANVLTAIPWQSMTSLLADTLHPSLEMPEPSVGDTPVE
jgi:hypothetical protein